MEKDLTPQNIENLPMFNILNKQAYVPRNTVFIPSLFAQAQGSMQPRHNQDTMVVKHGKPVIPPNVTASLMQRFKNMLG